MFFCNTFANCTFEVIWVWNVYIRLFVHQNVSKDCCKSLYVVIFVLKYTIQHFQEKILLIYIIQPGKRIVVAYMYEFMVLYFSIWYLRFPIDDYKFVCWKSKIDILIETLRQDRGSRIMFRIWMIITVSNFNHLWPSLVRFKFGNAFPYFDRFQKSFSKFQTLIAWCNELSKSHSIWSLFAIWAGNNPV